MKKGEFKARIKDMLKDVKDGLYGLEEVIDEIWGYIQEEQWRNKELWREVKKLRRQVNK